MEGRGSEGQEGGGTRRVTGTTHDLVLLVCVLYECHKIKLFFYTQFALYLFL